MALLAPPQEKSSYEYSDPEVVANCSDHCFWIWTKRPEIVLDVLRDGNNNRLDHRQNPNRCRPVVEREEPLTQCVLHDRENMKFVVKVVVQSHTNLLSAGDCSAIVGHQMRVSVDKSITGTGLAVGLAGRTIMKLAGTHFPTRGSPGRKVMTHR